VRLSSDPAARRRLATLAAAAAIALAAGVVTGAGAGESESGNPATEPRETASRLDLRQRVGQVLVSGFDGTRLPAYLRRRLRAGETAGVILFRKNVASPGQLAALTRAVQREARRTALVMVDQEGGSVRRLPFAGPAPGQPAQGSPRRVRRLTRLAGRQLRSHGVNVNLAPVADVRGPGSALARRTFAGGSGSVAARVRAAVRGYRAGQVASTAKHFPGLGAARVNTDHAPATVALPRGSLEPFRSAIALDVPLVMASHGLFPALDRRRIASQSRATLIRLLRGRLRFRGVTVTDSIEARAVIRRSGVATAAERSIAAGADLVLMTGSASWNLIFPRLLRKARREPGFRKRVTEAAARVLGLTRKLGLPEES
jgi:beta-N-acetylhexosaminidase